MKTIVLVVALGSLLLSGSGVACQGRRDEALSPGNHRRTLEHQGRSRWYLVHIPPAASTAGPLPLVVAFHGGGGEPAGFQRSAGLDAVADREGFVVAYPAGTGPLPRRLLTWNAGTGCCGRALEERVDDVGFTRALVSELGRRVQIDPDRVYVTGHSNGAMMGYRVAAEAADLVAAAVLVAGAMQLASFTPTRPVPILHIHSVDDPRALYEGGTGPPFPLWGGTVDHRPVEDGLGRWAERNGCRGEPRRLGLAREPGEGRDWAEHLVWGDCPVESPVELWRLHGPGHAWPGALSEGREELVGPPTQVISAAEEAWRFFSRFRRPGSGG